MTKKAVVIVAGIIIDLSLLLFLIINTWATTKNNGAYTKAVIPTPVAIISLIITPTPTITPTLPLTPSPTVKPKLTPTLTQIITIQSSSPQTNFDELFTKYGNQYGVDPEKLKSIASCESGFDPNQITGIYGGLFQFSSLAWSEARARIGMDATDSLRFNAEESIRTAAHEIKIKGTSGWSDCD